MKTILIAMICTHIQIADFSNYFCIPAKAFNVESDCDQFSTDNKDETNYTFIVCAPVELK